MLDGDGRETGGENQELVLEGDFEAGDRLLRQGDEHRGSRRQDVRRHCPDPRCHGREGMRLPSLSHLYLFLSLFSF